MQYDNLAEVYNERMLRRAEESKMHTTWLNNMEKLMKRGNLKPKSLLDIGCGTGLSTFRWALKGIESYGVDISKPMLDMAMRVAKNESIPALFLQQDMTKLNMHRTFDAVTSVFDAMSHVLKGADLQETFVRVFYSLNKKGVFMFDMNTEYRLQWLHGRTKLDSYDNFYVISRPTYNKELKLANFNEVYFIKRGKLYEMVEENIRERSYPVTEVKRMLKKAGFKKVAAYDAETLKRVNRKTYRVMYVGWKVGK